MKDRKTAKKDRRRPRKEKEKRLKRSISKKKMKSKSRKRELSKKKQRGGAEKPEMIGRIQSNLITMLMKPQIKFLPSSSSMGNYLEDEEENMMYAKMVTKEELANIVNQNPEYKKSPTIQQIFKMNNFKVDKKEQVSFNFNNIICRDTNLIEVENKKRAVNILLNAILDCNSSVRMREIQKGGNEVAEILALQEEERMRIDEEKRQQEERKRERMEEEEEKRQQKEQAKKDDVEEENRETKETKVVGPPAVEVKKEESGTLDDALQTLDNFFSGEPTPEEPKPEPEGPKPEEPKPEEPKPEPEEPKDDFKAEKVEASINALPDEMKKDEIDRKIEQAEDEGEKLEEKVEEAEKQLEEFSEKNEEEKAKKIAQVEQTLKEQQERELKEAAMMKIKEENERKSSEQKKLARKVEEEKERLRNKYSKGDESSAKRKAFREFVSEETIKEISNNAIYNVDWFNVCCGIEELDDVYENKAKNLTKTDIDPIYIVKKIKMILDDKTESIKFRRMIKDRLLKCCKCDDPEEPFFGSNTDKTLLASFKECDKRDPTSVLFLYDGYLAFLEKRMDLPIGKMDRALILIFCEARQRELSNYIRLELIRRENGDKGFEFVIEKLDKIMELDKEEMARIEQQLQEEMGDDFEKQRKKELSLIEDRYGKNNIALVAAERKLQKAKKEKEENDKKQDKLEGISDRIEDDEARELQIKEKLKDMKDDEKRNFLEKEAERSLRPKKVDDGAGIVKQLENMFTESKTKVEDKSISLGELKLTLEEEEALKKSQAGGAEEENSNSIYTKEQINEMCNQAKETKQVSQAILSIIDKCKF